jgi:hypothetical protein
MAMRDDDQKLRVSVEQALEVPPDVGLRYLTTMDNWREFLPGFVRFAEPGRWQQPGDRASVLIRSFGSEAKLEMEMLELEPGRRVRFSMRRAGVPELHHERVFLPTETGCRCEFAVTYRPRAGLLSLLDTAVLPRILLAGLQAAAAACRRRLQRPSGGELQSATHAHLGGSRR